jgi:hypothetical protein
MTVDMGRGIFATSSRMDDWLTLGGDQVSHYHDPFLINQTRGFRIASFDSAAHRMIPNSPSLAPMFTVPEVAALLHKHPVTIRNLARRRAIPGAKRVGREWLFQRGPFERFVAGK